MFPIATTTYQTYYIHYDDRSEIEKCMESSGYEDILQKNLRGEQLSQEEAERITTCVKEHKQSKRKMQRVILFIIVVLIIVYVFTTTFLA